MSLPSKSIGSSYRGAPIPRAGIILAFAMGACAVYYLLAITSVFGDFQGDSWDYLNMAAQMRAGIFHVGSYSVQRGLWYPWFLSVTWLHTGLLTYFIQISSFLLTFYSAVRLLGLNSNYNILSILVAMIPAVAFLQRQIYPDGILLTIALLFLI